MKRLITKFPCDCPLQQQAAGGLIPFFLETHSPSLTLNLEESSDISFLQKYVHKVLVNYRTDLPRNSMVRITGWLNMAIFTDRL